MINITHTKANNPSVRIGSMILIIRRIDSSTVNLVFAQLGCNVTTNLVVTLRNNEVIWL